jgi:hypothetical protein
MLWLCAVACGVPAVQTVWTFCRSPWNSLSSAGAYGSPAVPDAMPPQLSARWCKHQRLNLQFSQTTENLRAANNLRNQIFTGTARVQNRNVLYNQ